mgnify:FL=1
MVSKLNINAEPEHELTVFDEQSQITHMGQFFSNENTLAFIFAKIWPEEEGRQVVIMEFCDKHSVNANRMPAYFKDLFTR